jgi:hypothetical protein
MKEDTKGDLPSDSDFSMSQFNFLMGISEPAPLKEKVISPTIIKKSLKQRVRPNSKVGISYGKKGMPQGVS